MLRAFLIALVFVTAASSLVWLDFFRVSEAEMSIVVIGKGEKAGDAEEIAGNMTEVAGTLSFYDRLLSGSEDLSDPAADLSPDKRKEAFRRIFSARHEKGSGVIVLSARDTDPGMAKLFVTTGARTLFALSSFYYNIKTDADMRVIDGPIVKTEISHPVLFALTSFSSALAVTGAFFALLNFVPALFGRKKSMAAVSDRRGTEDALQFDPRAFIPVKPEKLSFEENIPAEPKTGVPENLPVADFGAPDLPFATGDLPFAFEEVSDADPDELYGGPIDAEEKAETVAEEMPVPIAEPTVEEYKQRLNELLKGSK